MMPLAFELDMLVDVVAFPFSLSSRVIIKSFVIVTFYF